LKLLAATTNKNKLQEFSRILSPLGVELISPAELGIELDVEENGVTFAENARIKAEAFYKRTGLPTVADDSGLCVDALDGRPGVHSARYLGGAPQAEKNAALLKEMECVKNRAAQFVCAICCVLGDQILTAEGVCEGEIALVPSGEAGFGYDPVFVYEGRSFAEISAEEKDAVSHRGKALKSFALKIQSLRID
jgi:XTP/dITP diphosphohydrolase